MKPTDIAKPTESTELVKSVQSTVIVKSRKSEETLNGLKPATTFKELLDRYWKKQKMGEASDPQTGIRYVLLSEAVWDTTAATLSVLYLLFVLVFLCWALFDIYHGQNQVLARLFSKETIYPDSSLGRLIAYAIIGGAMGAVVDGFRSFVHWHSEMQAFGWRFLWKYVTLPPLGALLAAIVYALVQGGIAVFGGSFTPEEGSANQALTAFGLGALAGYGSHKAFKWLDYWVNRIFATRRREETQVPDLTDMTEDEAVAALKEVGLKIGKIEQQRDKANAGKVISQTPKPDSKLAPGTKVDITVATE